MATADQERAGQGIGEWTQVLDRLEADLATSERAVRHQVVHQESLHGEASFEEALAVAWAPPAVAGPMPAPLLPRAQELHRRQRELAGQVLQALRSTMQVRAYVDLTDRGLPSLPHYVDVVG